jgi:hypothetical protein
MPPETILYGILKVLLEVKRILQWPFARSTGHPLPGWLCSRLEGGNNQWTPKVLKIGLCWTKWSLIQKNEWYRCTESPFSVVCFERTLLPITEEVEYLGILFVEPLDRGVLLCLRTNTSLHWPKNQMPRKSSSCLQWWLLRSQDRLVQW